MGRKAARHRRDAGTRTATPTLRRWRTPAWVPHGPPPSSSRSPRPFPWPAGLAAALALAGCRGRRVQSALHPAGPEAADVAWLWWFMFVLLAAVFVAVVAAVLVAVARRLPEGEPPPLGNRFIVVTGLILPSVVLIVLLFYSLELTVSLRPAAQAGHVHAARLEGSNPLRIRVIGHQWWWEVEYPELGIVDANEIHIPAGEPVRLELSSFDVIHSFWVPELAGKLDMLPEHLRGHLKNVMWITADQPGSYRGQCAEFCGLQHALMAFVLVAHPREEFDAWVAERQTPPPEPDTELLERGKAAFFRAGCDRCHAIHGTPARGLIGPDLTHMGSRRTIGAGWLPNTHGNLAGWIVNPQALKPGNRMPRTFLEPAELHAVTAYLESLK